MDILKVLTIATILFLPVGEAGRYLFPSLGSIPLLINDILVGITVGFFLFSKIRKGESVSGSLRVPILVWIFICSLSLLVNSMLLSLPQVLVSSLYILRWSAYAGLYLLTAEFSKEFKRKILFLLVSIGQVIVAVGYLQYFFYPSLRNLYYLGWDEHLYRMFSVFLDPNFAGVFFVLVFLLTVGLAWYMYERKHYWWATILCMFSSIDLVAVYLTYSRSALLMLLVSVFCFLWFYGKQRYIFLVSLLLLAFLLISPKSFQTEGTNIFRIASSEARITSAQTAIEIAQKQLFFGVGFNAYRYAQHRYGYLTDRVWEETHAGAGTDNSYLFVFATTGIFGICVYLFLLYRMFFLAKRKKDMLHTILGASLVGVFVSGLFINALFYIFIIEWLWILLGATENNSL